MAAAIVSGSLTDCLTYDSEHGRITQVQTTMTCASPGSAAATTVYLDDETSGAISENYTSAGAVTWRDYISAPGEGFVAERFNSAGAISISYFAGDWLGSISILTDTTGTLQERNSYDAWGRRRNANGTDASACTSVTSATTRGFTSQEHIDPVCAINLNARLYDPTLGRFLSADDTVGDPLNGQSYNPFSYTNNNPLNQTDPTGNTSHCKTCLNNDAPEDSLLDILGDVFEATASTDPVPMGNAYMPQLPDSEPFSADFYRGGQFGDEISLNHGSSTALGNINESSGSGSGGGTQTATGVETVVVTGIRASKPSSPVQNPSQNPTSKQSVQNSSNSQPKQPPVCPISAESKAAGRLIVAGTAISLVGGGLKLVAPAAVVAGGGPENPIGDAAAFALNKVGDVTIAGGTFLAMTGAAKLSAANGDFREAINQTLEAPLDLALSKTGVPEGGSQFVDLVADKGLNDIEDALHAPLSKCRKN